MKAVLIAALLIKFSHQQTTNVTTLEADLMNSIKFLDSRMKKVSTSITSCVASANVASLNLKAAQMPKELTDSLDNLSNYLTGLQIISYFGSLTKCQELTTCECLNFRIFILDFHANRIDFLNEKFGDFKLQEIFNTITWNYGVNFKRLQIIWTREVAIIKVITQTRSLLNEFVNTKRNLDLTKKYYNDLKSFLISDISSCLFGNSTFFNQGSDVEENLRTYQKKLQDLSSIALEKINISLNSVTSSKKVKSSIIDRKTFLRSLYDKIKGIQSCDNYMMPKLTWPRIVSLL
jgi:hypothetical protein